MKRGILIAAVLLLAVAGGGALLLRAWINFHRPQPQLRCRSVLESIYTASKMQFAEKDHYTADFAALGITLEADEKYAYVTAAAPISVDAERTVLIGPKARVTEDDLKRVLESNFAGNVRPGVSGVCPDECEFAAICVGNIDNDEGLDIWSISSKDRQSDEGEPIPAGSPFHEQDDLAD